MGISFMQEKRETGNLRALHGESMDLRVLIIMLYAPSIRDHAYALYQSASAITDEDSV
jgi:hypothetical protein